MQQLMKELWFACAEVPLLQLLAESDQVCLIRAVFYPDKISTSAPYLCLQLYRKMRAGQADDVFKFRDAIYPGVCLSQSKSQVIERARSSVSTLFPFSLLVFFFFFGDLLNILDGRCTYVALFSQIRRRNN